MLVRDFRRALAGAFAVGLVLSAFPSLADAQGTPEQRRACRRDALKFCFREIPNVERIKNCLIANIDQLSPACRAQFEPQQPVEPELQEPPEQQEVPGQEEEPFEEPPVPEPE